MERDLGRKRVSCRLDDRQGWTGLVAVRRERIDNQKQKGQQTLYSVLKVLAQ
jgi:hypothetical protein